MPGWSERQRALLHGMGLDWPAGATSAATAEDAAPVAAPQPTLAKRATAAQARMTPETPAPASVEMAPAPQPASTPIAAAATAAADTLADLDAVAAAVRSCRNCGLCETRKQAVPGIGHPRAHWMLVGEGPGEQEDEQGEPFVGRSGQLLDEMLGALGLSRQPGPPERQVFIANTVKCRPPGNRNPSPEELAACAPYLRRQIALVRPRVVLALGRFAAQSLLGSDAPLGGLRGRVHRLSDGTPMIVSYHPAYLLRQPLEKARSWDDLCLAASQLTPHE